ncbi:aminotransferase class V-fold PLP-dependent enzyme [Sphingomonas baiyangensis]|nr:aminotransferase class V-fold PLP-dependent enzyme [Sphingomonas baiyangensis]
MDDRIKSRFLIPEGTYLLSHSVGCQPVGARAALDEALFAPWANRGGDAWPGWLATIEGFRCEVAALIGADPSGVCPQTNVSSAVAKIIHALPQREGRRVLLLGHEDFPSIGFVLAEAARYGWETRFLPADADPADLATWETALGDDVQAALVTHAFSNRSALLPVRDIARAVRAAGATSIVDCVQTLGVLPVDVADWGADYVVGSSVKFLCGGPGAAFLWGSADAIAAARPVDTGWFSHENPFEFDIHHFRMAGDALRFWGGTPSVAPFALAAHAIAMLREIGVDAIAEHNQALIDRLHDRWGSGHIRSATERGARGNAVLLAVHDPAAALATLRARAIYADARQGAIRVAPHLYNDDADIDELCEALAAHHPRSAHVAAAV